MNVPDDKIKLYIIYGDYMMDRGRINRISEKLMPFFLSDYYMLLLVAGACVFVFTGTEVLGTYIISLLSAFTLFLGEDILPALQGIMVMSSFAIRCKYSTGAFLKLWPLGIIVIILFFSHFFLYPVKLKKGGITYGMAATSLAIVLGGAGVIYWKTYFSPTSLFYMCLLGFGMLLIYSYFNGVIRDDRGYDFEERFSKIMLSAVFTVCLSLFAEYFMRREEFLSEMSIIPFQWRNNGATILMLAMPFAFFLSFRKYRYMFAGLLAYAGILFTGSRGGLIFGSVEIAVCFIAAVIMDKKHRKYNLIVIGICCLGVILASRFLMEMLRYTIERFLDPDENSIRIEMFERGIKDFRSSPVVGRGLAYMGNRDVHASAKHTLCWYHCSFIQVPASFGVVGILAYLFLNIQRIKIFVSNLSVFSVIMFISFIGLEMMSLVNPGIFCPFPYLFLVTLYFSIMERCETGNKESLAKLKRGENI